MLNIEIQLCGLIFDLILIAFVARHESVGRYNEKIFRQCLFVYTTCVMLDIISVFGIKYSNAIPSFVTVILCKIYLVSLMVSAYFGFAYTYNDVIHLRENITFKKAVLSICIIGGLIILFLPISYIYKGRVVYSYGPAANATYFFAPLFLMATLISTFIFGKQMNVHRRKAIRSWMFIEMTAAVIQFFMPQYLLVGFGSSVGLFILYAELENPEVYIDRTSGCFSMETFRLYIAQEYSDVKHFSAVIVCNEQDWKRSDEEEKSILVEMSDFLNTFGDAKVFRLDKNDFVLIYDKKSHEMNEIESAINLDVIRQRFKQPWVDKYFINAKFLYVPKGHIVSSMDEFEEIYMRNRDRFAADEDMRILDESSGEDIKEYRKMVFEIRDALSNDRVEVFYQPIYSVATDKFVSAEALARIRGTDGKLIMPARFIPVAEEVGLIEQVGERVFSKACQCIKENQLKTKGVDYIEVNLSISQCENPLLSVKYDEIMKNSQVRPQDINLEITENVPLNHRRILLENMNKLINMGCHFSLDDFGTGESNLNYIVDMPVQIVKFDRTMIQDYFSNERAKVVMKATVKMIKELGMKIVAEGVETEEQVEGIKELGIDYIQGFYYSVPLSQNDYIKFIEKKNKDLVA